MLNFFTQDSGELGADVSTELIPLGKLQDYIKINKINLFKEV